MYENAGESPGDEEKGEFHIAVYADIVGGDCGCEEGSHPVKDGHVKDLGLAEALYCGAFLHSTGGT